MRLIWLLGAVVLLLAAAFGTLISAFGSEAIITGANPGAWLFWFGVLVVAPLAGVVFCARKAFRRPQG